MKATTKLPPIHPGEVLREEFLGPMKIGPGRLAKEIGVSARRVIEIVQEKRGITVDTASALNRHFGTSPEFWLNLQSKHDFEMHDTRSDD